MLAAGYRCTFTGFVSALPPRPDLRGDQPPGPAGPELVDRVCEPVRLPIDRLPHEHPGAAVTGNAERSACAVVTEPEQALTSSTLVSPRLVVAHDEVIKWPYHEPLPRLVEHAI